MIPCDIISYATGKPESLKTYESWREFHTSSFRVQEVKTLFCFVVLVWV